MTKNATQKLLSSIGLDATVDELFSNLPPHKLFIGGVLDDGLVVRTTEMTGTDAVGVAVGALAYAIEQYKACGCPDCLSKAKITSSVTESVALMHLAFVNLASFPELTSETSH